MRTVALTEYVPSEPVPLNITERDTLRQFVPGLAISPAPGNADAYILTSSSTVGVVRVGDLTIELRPKIGIPAVLFLVSYALDPKAWKSEPAQLARDANLAEAIVPLFARTAQHAIRPGLLHGYRQREDTLTTVRGRIRIADQFRSRAGLPLPVEVSYDDFTPDILENQLLRTAVDTLGRLYLRHQDSRAFLARLRQQLNGVSIMPPDRRGVPEPQWTRLNERYRAAAGLARLVISTSGLEARAGGEDASIFLINMNTVFERFVRTALRETLRLDMRAFPAASSGRKLHLDDELEIPLEPDLSWWVADHCVFAGDCKYKKNEGNTPNADVYQMLAYLTALQLRNGLLVYAGGEDLPHAVTIPFADKRVLIRTVDVAQEPAGVLAQVAAIARLVRSIAAPLLLPGAVPPDPSAGREGGLRLSQVRPDCDSNAGATFQQQTPAARAVRRSTVLPGPCQPAAEDLVQASLVKLYRAWPKLQRGGRRRARTPAPWVCACVLARPSLAGGSRSGFR